MKIRIPINGPNNTLYMDADVVIENYIEERALEAVQASWLAEVGLDDSHKMSGSYNADDTAYMIPNTGIFQDAPVGLSDAFTFSTEGQFGFHAAGTTATTTSQSISHPKGRAYTTRPVPPILFSITAQSQDSRSYDVSIWKKPGIFLMKIRYAQYSGNPPDATYIMLISSREFRIFGKSVRPADAIPLWAATYANGSTSPSNTYKLGTMFDGSPNTLVRIRSGMDHKPRGTWESSPISLGSLEKVVLSSITWESEVPEGTTLQMEARTSGGWVILNQGDPIPDLLIDKPMKDLKVFLRATLETQVASKTPTLRSVQIQTVGSRPPVDLDLFIDPLQRFHNNEGPILVTYEQNLGHLVGEGGSVESFAVEFAPIDLIPKPNPGIHERAQGGLKVSMNLLGIEYTTVYAGNQSRARGRATVKVDLIPVGIVNP